jgi:hypothetical protein
MLRKLKLFCFSGTVSCPENKVSKSIFSNGSLLYRGNIEFPEQATRGDFNVPKAFLIEI